MYPVSQTFQDAVKKTDRTWDAKLQIITAYETLNLNSADIVQNSLQLECANGTSGDKFEIGSAVAADLSVTLLNTDGRFDDIQFDGAQIRPSIGLEVSPGNFEYVPLGIFNIDDVSRPTTSITLQAADNMLLLDQAFSDINISFPATNLQILTAICQHCGIMLKTASFLNSDYCVTARPDSSISCRDVVGHIAKMAGCFARCDRLTGALEMAWYDNPGCIAEADANGGDFVIHTDKNLLPNSATGSKVQDGITFTVNANKSITMNGTKGTNVWDYYLCGIYSSSAPVVFILPAGTYAISMGTSAVSLYLLNGTSVVKSITGSGTLTVTSPQPITSVMIRVPNGSTINNVTACPQLEFGPAATTYEPYHGYYIGDDADGGDFYWYNNKSVDFGNFKNFTPAVTLDPSNRYSFKIEDNPVTITGVKFNTEDKTYLNGSEYYSVDIGDNPFLQNNVESILQSLANKLIGFTYLPYTSDWQGNPALDPGDAITMIDLNGKSYNTIVTNSSYKYRGSCSIAAKGASILIQGYQSQMVRKISQLQNTISQKQVQIDSLQQAIASAVTTPSDSSVKAIIALLSTGYYGLALTYQSQMCGQFGPILRDAGLGCQIGIPFDTGGDETGTIYFDTGGVHAEGLFTIGTGNPADSHYSTLKQDGDIFKINDVPMNMGGKYPIYKPDGSIDYYLNFQGGIFIGTTSL